MHPPSAFLLCSFTLVVLVTVGLALRAVGSHKAWLLGGLWLIITGGLASSGLLTSFEAFPPPLLRVVLPTLLATALLCSSSLASAWLRRWSLAGIVAFQGFRLPLELVMHDAYREGVMPLQITFTGRNFDILTGLLALPLAWLLAHGRAPGALAWAWNLMGLGLLVNVVGVAVLSMPGPMQMLTLGPANIWVAYFPFIWLPTVLVPLALAGHILVARKLLLRSA